MYTATKYVVLSIIYKGILFQIMSHGMNSDELFEPNMEAKVTKYFQSIYVNRCLLKPINITYHLGNAFL